MARELNLELPDGRNEPGMDATDRAGKGYQIKCRHPSTLNVDLNNFEFDYLVLVSMDDACRLIGMWNISSERAKSLPGGRLAVDLFSELS